MSASVPLYLSLTGGTVSGNTVFNGNLTGAAFGTTIGSVLGPLVNFQGSGIPGLNLSSQLIFNRATPGPMDGGDIHIRRAATYSGGSSGSQNFALLVDVSAGATTGSQEWATLSKIHQSSASGSSAVAGYFQGWRIAGNGHVFGLISETTDFIGTKSSLSGDLVSVEIDLGAADVDDGANANSFGGIGVRKAVHLVFAQASSSVNAEYSSGLWFGTQTNGGAASFVDSLLAVQGNATSTRIRNFLDSRGAIAPPGVTDPVAAVRMSAGHIVDFNGGPALNSAPGNYLQYQTGGGSNRLRYMVGSSEVLSVADSGAVTLPQINMNTTSGPRLRSGAGAASGIQPKGSIWMRTDGGVGSTLYVSQGGGTWNAVAGV